MLRQSFSYKGVLFPAEADIYSPESISYAENHFQVLDDDIFNVTYPKSGSNWMLEILSLIREDGDVSWCHSMPSWERGPWVEASGSRDRLEDAKRPRIVSSHLPVQLFPKSFWGSKAKVIYTVRNPKDLLVSLQHYSKLVCFLKDPLSLDELLGAFLRGEVQFGSWFDHVKGWLELHGRENFFWISYEELKEDLPGSVGRICHFLGKDLAADALASVVENASFQTMRNNPMTNYSLAPPSLMDQSKGLFLRKGVPGRGCPRTPVPDTCLAWSFLLSLASQIKAACLWGLFIHHTTSEPLVWTAARALSSCLISFIHLHARTPGFPPWIWQGGELILWCGCQVWSSRGGFPEAGLLGAGGFVHPCLSPHREQQFIPQGDSLLHVARSRLLRVQRDGRLEGPVSPWVQPLGGAGARKWGSPHLRCPPGAAVTVVRQVQPQDEQDPSAQRQAGDVGMGEIRALRGGCCRGKGRVT
ncbi:sulfotransferase 2B1-like isoform X2 [Carettochelys insculpta]